MNYFVDVIVPIPLQQLFTYSINREEAKFLKPGMRVAVPFGKSKIYTSIVYRVHDTAPIGYEVKDIYQILDEIPIVTEKQLEHWQWMASYYMCTLGEVLKSALSKSFLLESETVVVLNKDLPTESLSLNEDEHMLFKALQLHSSISIDEISNLLDRVNVFPVIHKMVEKKLVLIEEEIIEQYKPKLIRYIALHEKFQAEKHWEELLQSLDKTPKQKQVVLSYFMLVSALKSKGQKPLVTYKELQEKSNVSDSTIKALINKEILNDLYIQKDRLQFDDALEEMKVLSPSQQKAFADVEASYKENQITLLHGVTSSGKTEIYVKLIEKVLSQGKQVLYILPEIALTTQLITRLKVYFGNKIAVYHSRYSANERIETWHHVLQNNPKAQLIIGARSAVFLPFQELGLVVVDEEHEASFKQFNPAPRYHARDSAIVLATLHQAKVLLGSATPAMESFYNARHHKYALVTLKERYSDVLMPHIKLVDLKESHFKKQMKGHFSQTLITAIEETLAAHEQVILFQNRRGFAPVVECETCGNAPQCPNCDVSLTYHQHKKQLRCHYCGYHMAMLEACMACGSSHLNHKGLGTEQIETELKALFPDYSIARMDQDTTRGKFAHAKLIEAIESNEVAIVVGTQMVAKGLDFRNVGLVGVMNADTLLNFPDFRAHERSFQMLTQVSGRAGRTEKQGRVIIQTYRPEHPVLQQVLNYDYEAMFQTQLDERREYRYPPFFRMIKITVKHRKYNVALTASQWLQSALQMVFSENVLGPEAPPVGRIKNEFLFHILIKIPKEQSLTKTKAAILKIQRSFFAVKDFRSVKLVLDVDYL